MSAPFTTTLRTGTAAIWLGTPQEATISLRVQIPEIWETIRVDAPPATAVAVVKERALAALLGEVEYPEDYGVRLHGWEVLDENITLAAAGVVDGSILLVSGRRRRPVR